MNDLVTVTELRRSFNSPKRDAVRGNPQPQMCTNGSSQNLYFMEGIIESVRRERVDYFFFNLLVRIMGKNDWFHQVLLDENDTDGLNPV